MHKRGWIAQGLIVMAPIFLSAPGAYALQAEDFVFSAGETEFFLDTDGFRFGFRESGGKVYVEPHPESGLLAGHPEDLSHATSAKLVEQAEGSVTFRVATAKGLLLTVRVALSPGKATFDVEHVAGTPIAMALRSKGRKHGFGLADHNIGLRRNLEHSGYGRGFVKPLDTDITGLAHDRVSAYTTYITRMTNNFVIYPKHRFAMVNVDPDVKMVRNTQQEILQGSVSTARMDQFYFFFGEIKDIYKAWLDVRNESGYLVMKPGYAMFGVGWEAWGALAWNTSQTTVRDNIDRYLDLGYPLKWMVIGSGFWPRAEERFHATTSFGMWDPALYPDPDGLKEHFRGRGLSILLGLRIAFLVNGPFAEEGYERGYYRATKRGGPKIYRPYDFPRGPVYLLDTQNQEAVEWYADLAERWGADGFKEDLYSVDLYDDLPDDRIDPVNEELKRRGHYIIVRSTYLGSAGDLHRIDDFNYGQNQDRGPVNSLSLAYSGLPLTYMDIVGGTLAGQRDEELQVDRLRKYLMRNARTASLHPSMSMGLGPWRMDDEQTLKVVLESARMHGRLHPYFYSQAIRFWRDGFPWTMTPLPLAWPDDARVYGRENEQLRGYQWLIGDALMAVPLYGEDFETAEFRDVYLPEGVWIDYDTGTRYKGPKMLEDFPIPVEKTPLFVGGTGIVVEEVESDKVIRAYPVANAAETEFWGEDGETRSIIRIDQPEWSNPTVVDETTGREVPHSVVRHAVQFTFSEGHNYVIR